MLRDGSSPRQSEDCPVSAFSSPWPDPRASSQQSPWPPSAAFAPALGLLLLLQHATEEQNPPRQRYLCGFCGCQAATSDRQGMGLSAPAPLTAGERHLGEERDLKLQERGSLAENPTANHTFSCLSPAEYIFKLLADLHAHKICFAKIFSMFLKI